MSNEIDRKLTIFVDTRDSLWFCFVTGCGNPPSIICPLGMKESRFISFVVNHIFFVLGFCTAMASTRIDLQKGFKRSLKITFSVSHVKVET